MKNEVLKRVFSLVLSLVVSASVFVVPVFADYEPDDDFFAFIIEYVKQRNTASQIKGFYDQYKKTGVSVDTAWELAKKFVSNNYTDFQAGLSAVKTTYKNLSSGEQWKLLDFYNQVNINGNFNIDLDLFNNLKLDLFSNNVWDNSKYVEPASAYEGYIPASYSILKDIILPEFIEDPTSQGINRGVSSVYVDLFVAGPVRYNPSYDSSADIMRWKFIVPHSSSDYAYFNQYTVSRYFNCNYSSDLWRVQYRHFVDGTKSQQPSTNTYLYYGDSYTDYYNPIPTPVLYARYLVVPDGLGLVDLPENIYNYNITNVYNTNNDIRYVPYTPNANPFDNTDWLNTLKLIIDNNSVPVINITINPEPTPIPTASPNPTPTPTPEIPGESDSIWLKIFDKLLELFDFIGKILDYLNPFSDNFFLKGFEITLTSVLDFFGRIFDILVKILDYLNPFSSNFFLKIALVPEEGFLDEEMESLMLNLESRIPILAQLIDITNQLIAASYEGGEPDLFVATSGVDDDVGAGNGIFGGNNVSGGKGRVRGGVAPTLEVALPEKYGGTTVEIIDFSYFDDYRIFIHGFIIMASSIIFIKRLFKRLARIVF